MIEWITKSNRPWHVAGGMLAYGVGMLVGGGCLAALWCAVCVALTAECKDVQAGLAGKGLKGLISAFKNSWDWLDILATVMVPAVVTAVMGLWSLIMVD